MSSLNVLCAICNEFFNNTDCIYSTICGHIFHKQCLFHCLAIANTCALCRSPCHHSRVHRVYLNFSEPTEIDNIPEQVTKTYRWIYCDAIIQQNELLAGAIKADTDEDGHEMYIARVYLNSDLLPAYYVPQKGGVFAAWNCKSHFLTTELELLDTSDDDAKYEWVKQSNGEIPPYALITGYTETGENLYTARALHNGRTLYGKLHPSHGVTYMPYQGDEVNNKLYEVLVRLPNKLNTIVEGNVGEELHNISSQLEENTAPIDSN